MLVDRSASATRHAPVSSIDGVDAGTRRRRSGAPASTFPASVVAVTTLRYQPSGAHEPASVLPSHTNDERPAARWPTRAAHGAHDVARPRRGSGSRPTAGWLTVTFNVDCLGQRVVVAGEEGRRGRCAELDRGQHECVDRYRRPGRARVIARHVGERVATVRHDRAGVVLAVPHRRRGARCRPHRVAAHRRPEQRS